MWQFQIVSKVDGGWSYVVYNDRSPENIIRGWSKRTKKDLERVLTEMCKRNNEYKGKTKLVMSNDK